MFNPHNVSHRQQLMLTCCYQSVREHFSHLAIRDIIAPPHGKFDALLARQVAITLMRDAFGVPRRRIAHILERQRGRICTITKIIDFRRECPVFDAAYLRMADRAVEFYQSQIFEEAA